MESREIEKMENEYTKSLKKIPILCKVLINVLQKTLLKQRGKKKSLSIKVPTI